MSSRTHYGLIRAVPFLLGSLPLDSADGAAVGIDLSSLPWNELRTSLSDENILIETGPEDYIDQCYPVFPLPDEDRSHYDLLNQPSGVCMNQLLCGFKGCSPVANVTDLTILEKWQMFEDFQKDNFAIVKDLSNPSYNIPNYVLFPKVAGDVHAAVAFAKEHGIELSVKNSGHSYTGASTKADTLHLNMNQYRRYASEPESEALVECVADQLDLDDATLANQPCRLVLARNKKATLRVGGGENFDKVYSVVKAYNEAWNTTNEDGYKHLIVGGAAGTVSPLGWTFQGGLSGTTNGRTHGECEMQLSSLSQRTTSLSTRSSITSAALFFIAIYRFWCRSGPPARNGPTPWPSRPVWPHRVDGGRGFPLPAHYQGGRSL